MARLSPIQESFSSGEIDPRIRSRVSSDAYGAGLKRARNWYPLVQGPIRMREGSEFIEAVDPDNWASGQPGTQGLRSFTFQRGLDEDVIVEVGDDTIILRNSISGAPIVGGVTGNLIPDPFYTGGFPSSVWEPDRDKSVFNTDPGRSPDHFITGNPSDHIGPFFQGTPQAFVKFQAFTNNPANPPMDPSGNPTNGPDGFHGIAHENSAIAPIIIPAGSELLLNELRIEWETIFGSGSPSKVESLGGLPLADPVLRVDVGTAKGLADVFTSDIVIGFDISYQVTIFNFIPGAGNNSLFISIHLFWTGTTATVPRLAFSPAFNPGLTFDLRVIEWTAPLAGGSGSTVEFVSPYTAAQLECLQFCMDPGEKVAYFTHPEVETQRLRLDVGEWTFEALSTITLPTPFIAPTPNLWAPGNFPISCAFHEGRLWLGGSPNNPATLWASRSGNYRDFNNVAPNSKDDPLLFPLSSSGNIETLTSRKELVILTDISEVIGTSVGGVIAFDDFSFPKQTDWGSNCVQPIAVGRDMVYTSNSRKRIRTFADEGGTNFGWDGKELSLLAQDIFGSPVRRMVYLDEPGYQACFLLADGTMGMATFFYPEQVIGWWRYTTSFNGNRLSGDESRPGLLNQSPNNIQTVNQIMDITKINTSVGAKLWMIVNRVGFPGTQKPGHELLGFETGLKPSLDSFAVRSIDPVTLTCSDIDELTDQSVNVVVERLDPIDLTFSYTVHPNVTVIAGVSSPLEDWAAGHTAYLGLFYNNDCQLLSLEGVSQRGTSQVTKRRWNKVFARLNDSPVPLIEGIPAKDRTPATPMGIGEPLITGDTEIVDLGSGEGDLKITQDKPIITEITGIFGKVVATEV